VKRGIGRNSERLDHLELSIPHARAATLFCTRPMGVVERMHRIVRMIFPFRPLGRRAETRAAGPKAMA
jgi:hypothetical protein